MRVQFNPQSDAFWRGHFAQRGGVISSFQGFPYQRGAGLGSVFRSLLRAILPIAKTAGKAIGKQALRSGMGFAGDVLEGANVKESAIRHAKSGGAQLLHKVRKKLKGPKKGQKGGGIGKAKRGKKAINITVKASKGKGKRKPRQKKKDILGMYLA